MDFGPCYKSVQAVKTLENLGLFGRNRRFNLVFRHLGEENAIPCSFEMYKAGQRRQ